MAKLASVTQKRRSEDLAATYNDAGAYCYVFEK